MTVTAAHPSTDRLIRALLAKAPTQRARIERHLAAAGPLFWERAEAFSSCLLAYLAETGRDESAAVDAYLRMCREMVVEEVKFRRTGRYSATLQSETLAEVYSSGEVMEPYMIGLALSLFFWPNHYAMYAFFIQKVSALPPVKRSLEIGPGHGLYLVSTLEAHPDADARAVDISEASLRLSERFVSLFLPERAVRFEHADVFAMEGSGYDLVVMNEVLEHVEDAPALLARLRGLVGPAGRVFLTTCANCPAVDHIYLYNDVEHIQRELTEAGFRIEHELALAVDDTPRERWSERRTGVNYAALLAPVE